MRAAIAFSLVVIFSIVSIYFYTSANALANKLGQVAIDTANGAASANAPGAANVSAAVANANAAAVTANDFAKTILAVVGTLMTAVTSSTSRPEALHQQKRPRRRGHDCERDTSRSVDSGSG